MVTPSPTLVVVAAVLVAVAVAGVRAAGLPLRGAVVTASLRAGAQLAVVSALLAVVLDALLWTTGYVLVMLTVAAVTSARRTGTPPRRPWTSVPIVAGAVPVTLALVPALDQTRTVGW